ncbi:MAG TPA: type II toxin-antitoxin system RelE/ParE family toxin [Firmicutes bacterium]|nr:type II toxin-antitoxin system RelE/ParE family toxin [Bacillota bacterium]
MTVRKYHPRYTDKAIKEMNKLDRYTKTIIANWIRRNLDGIDNPRRTGKPLKGGLDRYWRYRIGDYRIVAEIVDAELIIEIVKVGHRRDVYE